MAREQDKNKKLRAPEETQKKPQRADSGDVSGQGRERRDDTDVFPQQRGTDDFGTHGGPHKHST